ncbi:chromo domain-containing protein LHP1 [Magnolia sinica]|uniref:chromo domain-containing protein LHP1 n=1 Tax=Magnolia sinica TaxID=86752 RepID=UPI002657E31D|nr:chromo domain-containing protein LHP1 [Magnolia sinica]
MHLQQQKEKEIEDRVEMKGGRTKTEAAPTPTPPSPKQEDDNGVAEEDEEEEEEEDEEEGGEGEDKESEDRPKLDDGFYEIEDVRKKRVRKGRLQYLIKWRGWPETANTWEPVQNLQSCADIIEAFEESLRASKSSRKRKRKYGGPHIQPKKKRTSGKLDGDSLLPPTLERPNPANGIGPDNTADDKTEGEGDGVEEHGNSGSKAEQPEQPTENGSAGGLQHGERKTENQDNANRGELQRTGCTEENSGNISILFPDSRPSEEDVSTDGHSKIECMQLAQSSRFTGAKKRKSGSVRRFKQDLAAGDPEEAQNAAARSAIDSRDKCDLLGIEDVESVGDEAGDRNKLDDCTNPPFITKLIKPIGYSASVSNNVQDVSVTFTALRSDGKEVVVDNKFLKANNPLLLIGFYEQHLRYSPPI